MNLLPGRLLVAVTGAAAPFAALALTDPHAGRVPTCPVRALLGVDCPGCGSSRALHDLGRGDVLAALDHNLLLMAVVLPLVAVTLARWVSARPPLPLLHARWAPVTALVVVAAWTVVRNLPYGPLEVLASTA